MPEGYNNAYVLSSPWLYICACCRPDACATLDARACSRMPKAICNRARPIFVRRHTVCICVRQERVLYQYKHALCHRFCKGMDSRAHVYKTSSFYYVQQDSVLYQYKHERGADTFTRRELLYAVYSRVATAFAKAWIVDSFRPTYVRPGASQTAAKVQRRSSNSPVVELGPRRSVRKILVRSAIPKQVKEDVALLCATLDPKSGVENSVVCKSGKVFPCLQIFVSSHPCNGMCWGVASNQF